MMKEQLERYAAVINRRLDELMGAYNEENAGAQLICPEAMRYSLSAGGKRIRPVLCLEFARIFGAEEKALDAACALEMIHTFSLIHDDLPCMDNDDFRRGKPSCHKQFDEAQALLAGDALENYAFEVIASDDKLSFEQRVKLIKCLSRNVGVMGMIGGQVIDVKNEGSRLDGESLLKMYSMKTSALIKCACEMGVICARRDDMLPVAEEYGECLGLAFQIVDDILDITADEKLLGKPVHSDEEQNKSTYPAIFGLEAAKAKAAELTDRAMAAIEKLPDNGFITELTASLLKRQY